MFQNLMRKGGVAGASALGFMASAHAAIDTAAVTGAGTDVAAVGAAVFAVYVGVKLFKWIRAAL